MVLTKIRHIYKKRKSEYSHWKVHLKKSAAPLKVKKKFERSQGSWLSVLVTRTQRKKLEFNPSYGYGEISNNVHKCAKCARIAHFAAFLPKKTYVE